jgi:hypothetical protein
MTSSLGVFRLRPVTEAVSKAISVTVSAAHSRPTELLFGRGRQSASPRIPGGLVSHLQGKRAMLADPKSGEAPCVPSPVPSARGLDHRDRLGKPDVERLEDARLHRGRGVPVDGTHRAHLLSRP